MNIKNLRKNYDKLLKRERFILYDAAENKDDKSEMDAISLATPNEDWIKPDFALQAEHLLKLRLVRIAQRLKHSREAMFWLSLSVQEETTAKSTKKDHFFYESARLNAYFYCITVEVSHSIYEDLGLDVAAWEAKEAQLFDLGFADEMTDWQMKNLAFDEKEAEVFINKIGKKYGINKITMGFTYDRELAGMREILKEKGFEEFFKK